MEQGQSQRYYDRQEDDGGMSEGELPSDDDGGGGGGGGGVEMVVEDSRRREEKKRSVERKSHTSHSRRDRRRSSDSDDDRDERRHRRKRHRRTSSRSRSRSRSKSTDHRRRHRKHRRSRSADSRDSNDDSWNYNRWDRDEKPQQDTYKNQVPNNTIMVRGLAPHLSENDIRQDLLKCGTIVKDIRLIRHRDTGSSRGFAFVEFHSVSDATKWMEMKKGLLLLQDQFEANLIYSISKSGSIDIGSPKFSADWYCSRCRAYNFKRRDQCYKCNEDRPPEEGSEYYNDISVNPTSTIMLFELDALTTEDGVLQAFQSNPALAVLPIRSVRIPRETGTNLSRRVCYVESNNVADAMRLYAIFTRDTLEIDAVQVQAAYYKIPSLPVKNSAAASALAAAQWTNNSAAPIVPEAPEVDIEKMAEYSASLYAKNDTEYASYLEYYRDYYTKQNEPQTSGDGTKSTTCQSEITSTASLHNTRVELAASGSQSSVRQETIQPEVITPAAEPDTTKFQYDEASGYYYDPVTGYYYDANTRYYYDSQSQQFLLWNTESNKFVPVTVTDDKSTEDNPSSDNKSQCSTPPEKKQKSRDKVKVAKNVAKEMEKWAKTLNQKRYMEPEPYSYQGRQQKPEIYSDSRSKPTVKEPSIPTVPENVVESDEDSSSNDRDLNDDNYGTPATISPTDPRFIDQQKIACLLCKRQFSSIEVLLKHAKMSELHKQNLAEVLGVRNCSPSSSNQQEAGSKNYRDRAKERRMKFGTQNEIASNSLKDLYMKVKEDINTNYVEEPNKRGIKSDNIGNKMLQKMGWQAGQGLGKDNKGIIDPIMAERRVAKVGLGLDVPGALDIDETDDRQTKARKLTIARYMKLD